MTIKKGTRIARRTDPEINGAYNWDTYGSNTSFIQAVGHHAPTLEQLTTAGWLLCADTACDPLTHKLCEPYADSWGDDGVYVSRKTVALTVDEIAANAVTAYNAKVKSMTDAVQVHLDATAQSWGYDNIISLCTYDGNSDPKYSAEGAAGKGWRSSVWRYCEDELAKIAASTRAEPESNEAFIAELPTITRPIV